MMGPKLFYFVVVDDFFLIFFFYIKFIQLKISIKMGYILLVLLFKNQHKKIN